VLHREHPDLVAVALLRLPRLDLGDVHREGLALHAQRERLAQQLLRAPGPDEPQRLGPALKSERPHQPDHAQEVVAVKMREEDVAQGEGDAVAHHLPLGPLAALEQQALAPARHDQRGDVALRRGPRGRRAEQL
jgi:hypothetical protein